VRSTPTGAAGSRPRAEANGDVEVAGVRITHPDRVVYPDAGITKVRVARYYAAIAPRILPHLRSWPAVLVRCPDGIGGECFYQKHAGAWASAALRRVRIREKVKTEEYVVVEDLTGLVGLIQMGVLEIHTWNAQADRIERPDRIIFDLDPAPDVPWRAVIEAARLVRSTLEERGLKSFVKTTGGKGLHIVAPLRQGPGWAECVEFARMVTDAFVAETPAAFTATMAKSARTGKIFIDYFRNQRGATSVAAYSTRAREGAPVSVPLTWNELGKVPSGNHFTMELVERRLRRLTTDPWAGYQRLSQSLPSPGRRVR
jgi:bifunctional non-homologous end joining protein LigD